MIECLRENLDIFAWSAVGMPGVDPQVIVYRLNVPLKVKTVKQKRRKFAP